MHRSSDSQGLKNLITLTFFSLQKSDFSSTNMIILDNLQLYNNLNEFWCHFWNFENFSKTVHFNNHKL